MGKIVGRFLLPHPPIILPQVGMGNQHVAFKTCDAMNSIAREISLLDADNIVIITPHGASFSDGISIMDSFFVQGDFKEFGSDFSMEKDINKQLVGALKSRCFKNRIPLISLDHSNADIYEIDYALDHGTMVPLHFIDKFLKKYKLTTITYGGINNLMHYKLGMELTSVIEELPGTFVIISSGDLSHRLIEDSPYGYHPHGEKFDSQMIAHLTTGDTVSLFSLDSSIIQESYQCALKSIFVMLGTLDEFQFKGDLISYEHPFGVGYCVLRINSLKKCETKIKDLTKTFERRVSSMNKSNPYVKLAHESIEYYIKHDTFMQVPSYVPTEMLDEKKGTFVSIKMGGELRGCIGTISPTCDTLGEEIIKNAIESCSHDPRFSPITPDEIPFLDISVDVLNNPLECSSEDLDPSIYGIIVSTETKRGVLLPNLDGINSSSDQLSTALLKAGISPEDNYSIQRFTVKRYS